MELAALNNLPRMDFGYGMFLEGVSALNEFVDFYQAVTCKPLSVSYISATTFRIPSPRR